MADPGQGDAEALDLPVDDDTGRPIDLETATAAALRRIIRDKEVLRAKAVQQERSAKDRQAQFESGAAAARKESAQAAATIHSMDRQLALLRNVLRAKA